MTCKECNRALYEGDANKDGLCCFCDGSGGPVASVAPVAPATMGQATATTLEGSSTVPAATGALPQATKTPGTGAKGKQ